MSNRTKIKAAGIAVLTAGALALSGCSTVSDNPDDMGLYYLMGSSDGNKFDACIDPGATGDAEWNNKVIWLPIGLHTWNIAPEGGQSNKPTVVSTKPEPGQPSGVQVKVWSATNFKLNTYCDKSGGTVKAFWENIGRTKKADTPAGLDDVVTTYLVPSLAKATQDVIRSYGSDELVGNVGGVRAKAQQEISAAFTLELKRLVGNDYFCGPAFNRIKNECPPIEMILVDVDFFDEGIQNARNEKQKAVELAAAKLATAQGEAAALLAEAKGKANAAAELAKLYANPAWVKLQDTILKTQALIEACKAAKECKLVVGADGNLIVS